MAKRTINLEDELPSENVFHPVRIEKVEEKHRTEEELADGKHNYLNWTLVITDGEFTGSYLWEMTSLSPKAAFRIRQLYESCGLPVPKKGEEWDENDLLTQQFQVQVKHERMDSSDPNSKLSAKIAEMKPLV